MSCNAISYGITLYHDVRCYEIAKKKKNSIYNLVSTVEFEKIFCYFKISFQITLLKISISNETLNVISKLCFKCHFKMLF